MATKAARATRRAVIDTVGRTAAQAQLACQVSAQIGMEWRAFCHLGFWGRLRWLLTGRIVASTPHEQAALDVVATERAEEHEEKPDADEHASAALQTPVTH